MKMHDNNIKLFDYLRRILTPNSAYLIRILFVKFVFTKLDITKHGST